MIFNFVLRVWCLYIFRLTSSFGPFWLFWLLCSFGLNIWAFRTVCVFCFAYFLANLFWPFSFGHYGHLGRHDCLDILFWNTNVGAFLVIWAFWSFGLSWPFGLYWPLGFPGHWAFPVHLDHLGFRDHLGHFGKLGHLVYQIPAKEHVLAA